MSRKFIFVLVLVLCFENRIDAQALKAPRDLSKLVLRAQEFWTAMAAGQRLKALDFVHPDKKEFLLSSGGMPFVNPQIIGVDFAADENRALVRVSVKLISPEAPTSALNWVVTDTWVWLRNNWFLDLQDSRTGANPFRGTPANKSVEDDALRKEAESQFKILDVSIDVGILNQVGVVRIPVRMEYTGDVPIHIESGLVSNLVMLEAASTQAVTPQSKEFGLYIDTRAWVGPFAVSVPLKVRYKSIVLDRLIAVKGSVFAPLVATQFPPVFTNTPEQELKFVIRNNTDESVSIVSVGSQNVFQVLRRSDTIPANGEAEILLRLNPTATTEGSPILRLNLGQPLAGKTEYEFKVRVGPTP